MVKDLGGDPSLRKTLAENARQKLNGSSTRSRVIVTLISQAYHRTTLLERLLQRYHSGRINVFPAGITRTSRLESIKMPRAKSHRSYRRFKVNPHAAPREFVAEAWGRAHALAHARMRNRGCWQVDQPGIVEEEGTIRGQIKTRRRVTVERALRNERVCDFGHAVRLYVDLRSTRGTERSCE